MNIISKTEYIGKELYSNVAELLIKDSEKAVLTLKLEKSINLSFEVQKNYKIIRPQN